VAASLREFGFRKPIVVDAKGIIIAGRVCWLAAKSLGFEKVPVHFAGDLSPARVRAYRVADNRLGEIAEWDLPTLSVELGQMQESGLDLALLGFGTRELAGILDVARSQLLEDDVPSPPAKATTRLGDLWKLGRHRLLCGSSADEAHVKRLVGRGPVHLVNMDPPYNVCVEPRSNNALRAAGKKTHHQSLDLARHPEKKATSKQMRAKDRPLANDFLPPAEFEAMLRAWFCNASRVLMPGGSFYIWGGYANIANYPAALKDAELFFAQGIIWIKEHPVMTRKDFMGNHEWCFYGWKEGAAHRFFGARNLPDVWQFCPARSGAQSAAIGRGLRLESKDGSRIDVTPPGNSELPTVRVSESGVQLFGENEASDVWSVKKVSSQKMVHLTEKPVELAARAMRFSSRPGENVLDLFGGSGSTMAAAEQSDRRALLMELDPPYCDVIVARWENLSGKKAELDKSGRL
jgi:DNA modification methylase